MTTSKNVLILQKDPLLVIPLRHNSEIAPYCLTSIPEGNRAIMVARDRRQMVSDFFTTENMDVLGTDHFILVTCDEENNLRYALMKLSPDTTPERAHSELITKLLNFGEFIELLVENKKKSKLLFPGLSSIVTYIPLKKKEL